MSIEVTRQVHEFGKETIEKAADLIREFEGLRLNAYLCPAKVWTIGWGHTGNVRPGMAITLTEADKLLIEDITKMLPLFDVKIKVPLTEGQLIALLSFAFNVGLTNFFTSTLLKKLNQKDYKGAAGEFQRWIYSRGKVYNGLKIRREKEKRVFCDEVD